VLMMLILAGSGFTGSGFKVRFRVQGSGLIHE
jgi:hypothetical protein